MTVQEEVRKREESLLSPRFPAHRENSSCWISAQALPPSLKFANRKGGVFSFWAAKLRPTREVRLLVRVFNVALVVPLEEPLPP